MSTPTSASRDETLNSFYQRGIGARHWEVFHETDPIRVVYVGDSTANLHHLVQSEQPANRLHFPWPPIKPTLPWKPDIHQTAAAGYLTSAVAQDLASFPARTVRDALVQTYFDDIHPCYPVIDEEEFRRHDAIPTSEVDIRATSRERPNTISSNSYHWVGQATRIALGLGMHRDLTGRSTTLMPGFDRRHYRRLWWLVLQAETMTALEYGRPSMVRSEDYDQPPLNHGEFRNFDGSLDTLICADYFLINSELCETALQVQALNAPNAQGLDSAGIDERLARLALRLPRMNDFWSCQLRMSYSLVVLVLHRTARSPDSPIIAREAASTILTTFETMLSAGSIRKCSFHCSTPLLAAGIQFFQDMKSAASTTALMRANAAHAQLERLLRPVEELAKYWPHVEALSKLCVSLFNRGTVLLGDATADQPGGETDPQAEFLAQADISWHDIMAGYQLPDLRQGLDTEEWMYSL
ncbi:hypothetical protein B0A54_14527 [Friedmanniomyces endolithicus]|uniref:Xylanolytic transcriptional activator regulatory domain-containing protein n=1 Tax=Friedmanniomyces endolithicus TaxID=329885 RepID=A0A4V5N5Y7_9PEZI|nr:hypothetical protein B0A54_14527 [Friedmanniomyces endolithicus]